MQDGVLEHTNASTPEVQINAWAGLEHRHVWIVRTDRTTMELTLER
jgi:hypothetical protein